MDVACASSLGIKINTMGEDLIQKIKLAKGILDVEVATALSEQR